MTSRPPLVTIYHNPACGTSRNTLALIRNAGVEPEMIEYLKTPPDRATLVDLFAAGMRPRGCCGRRARRMRSWGLRPTTGRTRADRPDDRPPDS